MDAAHLLTQIIAQNAPVSVARYRFAPALKLLIECGYIKETGVVQSVYCDECDAPHDAEVVFEAGSYGFYCPDLGFISKQRADLVAVSGDVGLVVEHLAQNLGCKRRRSAPVHGQTWRVGLVSASTADVAVYFQPTMRDAADLRAFEAAIARETKAQFGIVLTAYGELTYPPFQTLRLDGCLAFDISAMALEFDADLLEIVGAPAKRSGGRPSPYAKKLSKIILERVATGMVLPGQNEEAREILATYSAKHLNEPTPSISAIKRAMAKA